MSWRLAKRLYHPEDNLAFDSWGAGGTVPHWTGVIDPDETNRSTASESASVPWNGRACWRTTQTTTPGYQLKYDISGANPPSGGDLYWPEVTATTSKALRATVRVMPLIPLNEIFVCKLYVESGGASSSTVMPIVTSPGLGSFGSRLTTSWQLCMVPEVTWSTSQQVSFTIEVQSYALYDWALDDLRLFMDEFSIDEHEKQRVDLVLEQNASRALTGRRFVANGSYRRRWTLPMDQVSSLYWERLDRWHQEGSRLWITDQSCNSYPCVMTNDTSPVEAAYAGRGDLRSVSIELESDYRHEIIGGIFGEPLP